MTTTKSTYKDLTMSIEWTLGGTRPEPASLTFRMVDGSPINGDAVRGFPIGEMVGMVRQILVPNVDSAITGEVGPRRGQKLTAEDMRDVADVYLRAYERGMPSTRAVASTFQISTSAAAKRIMAARDAGLID